MKKRLLAILLALCCIFIITSCDNSAYGGEDDGILDAPSVTKKVTVIWEDRGVTEEIFPEGDKINPYSTFRLEGLEDNKGYKFYSDSLMSNEINREFFC